MVAGRVRFPATLLTFKPIIPMNKVIVFTAPAQSYMTTDCHKFFADFQDLITHLRTLECVDADGNLSTEIENPVDLYYFFVEQEYCRPA